MDNLERPESREVFPQFVTGSMLLKLSEASFVQFNLAPSPAPGQPAGVQVSVIGPPPSPDQLQHLARFRAAHHPPLMPDELHDCEGCLGVDELCSCCIECFTRSLERAQQRTREQHAQEHELRCAFERSERMRREPKRGQ